jgi:hypothetical protein
VTGGETSAGTDATGFPDRDPVRNDVTACP